MFKRVNEKNSNFRTLLCLLAYTGLRSSDVLLVKGADIDLDNLTMRYYSPKRKKMKVISFKPELGEILRERIGEVGQDRLLDYKNVESINHAVIVYLKQVGLDGYSYTARTFQKTFITLCRNLYKMDATIVRELVGHEHGNTTDRFYNKVSFEAQQEELKKFSLPIREWMKLEELIPDKKDNECWHAN